MTRTITLDLDTDLLERLHAVAQARGLDPNHYAAAAIHEALTRDAGIVGESELSKEEAAPLHAGIQRGLEAEAQGRHRPATAAFADLEARYNLPSA